MRCPGCSRTRSRLGRFLSDEYRALAALLMFLGRVDKGVRRRSCGRQTRWHGPYDACSVPVRSSLSLPRAYGHMTDGKIKANDDRYPQSMTSGRGTVQDKAGRAAARSRVHVAEPGPLS